MEHDAILVPGRGLVSPRALAVNKAIQEHDDRLYFGFNPTNEDWIIYIRMPREFKAAYYIEDNPVYPILGFGETIPEPHEALQRLHRADTRQHGLGLLERMNKENDKIKQFARDKQDEQIEETAERMEHETRKQGLTEKYTKVFF